MKANMHINLGPTRTPEYDIAVPLEADNEEKLTILVKNMFPGGTGLEEDNVLNLPCGGWVTVCIDE